MSKVTCESYETANKCAKIVPLKVVWNGRQRYHNAANHVSYNDPRGKVFEEGRLTRTYVNSMRQDQHDSVWLLVMSNFLNASSWYKRCPESFTDNLLEDQATVNKRKDNAVIFKTQLNQAVHSVWFMTQPSMCKWTHSCRGVCRGSAINIAAFHCGSTQN